MSSKKKAKYKNIAIAGLPGAGSSTLGKMLADKLEWGYYSGGEFMRAYAVEQGLFDNNSKNHHDATVYDDDFDRKIDYGMRKKLQNESNGIYDSWLAGFLAQGVKDTYKVLMICSNDSVRVDRLANRDRVTIMDAKKHVFERTQKNLGKWKRMYKNEWKKWVVEPGIVDDSKEIFFWYPEMYDLVIDSFSKSREEVLKAVLDEVLE